MRGLDLFRERSSLFKQVNYQKTSVVNGNTQESNISEAFESNGFRVLEGVFITTEEVVPTDLATVSVFKGNELLYEQEFFTGLLIEFAENFVSFYNVLEINGNY
ncbi:MAG: hypothetical protein AAGJ93_14205 [Bacteroidota bacterium]